MSESRTKERTPISGEDKKEFECPNCEESVEIRDYEENTVICNNCGRVIKDEIKDRGPEWRAYDQKEKENRSRGGPPMKETIHDKGLSTQIDWKNKDSKGNSISPEKRSKIYRMRKWNKSTKMNEQKDRNLSLAFSEIQRMSSQLGLPKNVRDVSSKIYRESVDEDLIRGHSIEGMATAALYIASRKMQVPRTLEEFAEVSYMDKNEFCKNYRYMARELDIDLPPADPVNYVARFSSDLEMSGEVKTRAMSLINKAQDERLTVGKGPSGIAAGAIYLASKLEGKGRTQSEVAEAAGVTEVTLRNRYKEIQEAFDVDV